MFNEVKKSIQWGEETLTLETGKVARQADGSVIATLGETSVMANVTFARKQKPGQDFFPLTVHYNEKYYAAGKVPGGFFKREARPTEKETLTSRLIDRPIRPLFVPGFKNEVLVGWPAATVYHGGHDVASRAFGYGPSLDRLGGAVVKSIGHCQHQTRLAPADVRRSVDQDKRAHRCDGGQDHVLHGQRQGQRWKNDETGERDRRRPDSVLQ